MTVRPEGVSIGGRLVGPGQPVYVIAEAGVNHNGDPRLARELVIAAAAAGADAVKFQTWDTSKLVTPEAPLAAYQAANVGADATSQYDMLKKLELSGDTLRGLIALAERAGIQFLSTPDEEDSADLLDRLGVAAFKIGSAEVTSLGFLEHVARKGKPVILSTGMASLEEVATAVRTLTEAGNHELILLHCVSDYPSKPADSNLRAMATLRETFACPVGFSDHTTGTFVAVAAVALGACVVEKHLTLDTAMDGPDHAASSDPTEFAAMVAAIRGTEVALGSGTKKPTAAELANRPLMRKHWVAARALPAGTTLASADLTLRRSNPDGLEAPEIARLIGRELRGAVRQWETLTLDKVK